LGNSAWYTPSLAILQAAIYFSETTFLWVKVGERHKERNPYLDNLYRIDFWLDAYYHNPLANKETKVMMRIGIMLRSFDEKGGVGVYSQNIVAELLNLDRRNEYILFYQKTKNIGLFSHHENVTERVLPISNKFIWDQFAVPIACRREKIDVVFHPKFTAPLLASCPAVMTVHGADWFIPEQAKYYRWLDVVYVRTMMPWYFRKCKKIISVSQLTTQNFMEVLNLPAGKVESVYFAPARHFKRELDNAILTKVKSQYGLPDEFLFTLTKRQGDARKNLGQIFKAYERYYAISSNPLPLVVGGKDAHLFRDEYRLPVEGYGKEILFPGWIEQVDLPAVYSLARLFLYPSNLEAFPIPVTEALACGTPIVTSNVNGLQEIAGDAAILVDPGDTEAIAQAVCQVLSDQELSASLSSKGLIRSALFDWDQCAHDTLAILESVVKTDSVLV
jgi:glycosyltransferase involved in cell wall biosynthesis